MALPSLRDFTSGVGQGWNTGQQMFDAGVAGLARAAGYQNVARDWERSADEQALEAQQYANPTTQVAPWREGGGGWGNAAPWLVNQAGMLIGGAAPLVAGGVAGLAGASVLPEAAAGAAVGLGMGLASYPQAVGANYQAEREANQAQGLGEVTPEQATSAAGWGVPSAALNAFAPTRAFGVGKTATEAVSRTMLDAAKGVAKTGVDNALATAGQKAIEHSFRPDMSDGDKTRDMLDSVVTGFIGGAGMGAAGEGVGRLVKSLGPNAPTADLDAATKQVLEPEKVAETPKPQIEGDVSFLDEAQPQGIEQTKARNRVFENEFDPRLVELDKQREAAVASGDPQALADWSREHLQLLKDIRERDEGFMNAGTREDVAQPDVPKQYLVEAEKAAQDGTLNQRMAAAEQAGDTGRLTAFQRIKNFIADQTGALKIGGEEKPDLQELLRKSRERGETATKLVEDAIASGKPKLILEKDGKSLVLSPGLEGKPYRMTSFDEKGPIGHRDYGEGDLRWMADEVSTALNSGFKPREQGILGKISEAAKKLANDETGSLRISSGADEAADFQALIDKKAERVQEPQPLHDLLQSYGGVYYTPDTMGHLEKLAPVGDKTVFGPRDKFGKRTVVHQAEPIERQIRAERPDITDKAERESLGLGGIDIHEAARMAVEDGYLPEGSGPNELVDLLHGDERAYSERDRDQAYAYRAQENAKQLDAAIKAERKSLKEQFAGEHPKDVIDEAAHLMATGEYSPEEAIQAAKEAKLQRERDLTPAVEGFADSAFMEPAEGVDVEGWRSKSPKQFRVEAKKLWEANPDDLDLAAAKYESEGDAARAAAYREYQAEQFAKKKPIVREVAGTKAVFKETPKGIERVPTAADATAPVDRPAGTPAIDGPLGRAPAVPPIPPDIVARPPTMDEAAGGGGGGGRKPPGGGGGGGGGEPPKPFPDKDYEGHPLRTTDDISGAVARMVRSFKEGRWGEAARQLGMWVFTEHHLDEMYGDLLPEFRELIKTREVRNAMNQRYQANALHNQAEMGKIAKDPKAQEVVRAAEFVERMHQLGIDPSKPFDKQSLRVRREGGRYADLHREGQEAWSKVLKHPDAASILENMRAQYETNYSMPAAAVLYRYLKRNKNLMAAENADLRARLVSPAHDLLDNPDADMSSAGVMAHAVTSLNDLMAVGKELLARLPEVTKKEIAKDSLGNDYIKETKVSADPYLQEFIENIESNKDKLKDTVYSHLMRQGKYGLSFTIATDGEGNIIPESLKRIQDAVKADGFNVVIDPLSHQPDVFIRTDNAAQLANLKRTIVKMSEAGDVEKDNIKHGTMDLFNKSGAAAKLVEKMIQELEASDEFTAPDGSSPALVAALQRKKDDQITMLRNMAIHFMPEASAAKSKLHRQYIAGFEADPYRALAKQSIEVAQHFSNLLGSDEVNDRLGEFKKTWEASKNVDHRLHPYEPTIAALYNHAAGREEDRQINFGGTWQDMVQSMVFSKGLGFNPSTAILQPLQMVTYVIPELSKKVGFMKGTTALAASTDDAFKVMGALWSEARNAGGLAITDMPITTEAIRGSGIDADNARFFIKVVNLGGVDTGGIFRSLGHIADARMQGSKFDRSLDSYTRASSMMGYYAETYSRVQTALAAKRVYEMKNGKVEFGTPEYEKMAHYAKRVVDESLFNYSNDNRSLMTSNGPKGLFGNTTKLAFVFQSYWMMAAEKMYREMHTILTDNPGLSKKDNAIARKEAWRFMLGHAAATAAIAGAIGLPGMTVFSSIYDKLHDKVKPEAGPYDVKQAFANYLETTFGHQIGDAIAHGPSRLLGADVSSRTSEADFAPVPSFLTDRGAMAPAVKKWLATRLGAGTSIMEELARGYDKYNNGDLVGAVASLFPAGGRNVILASQQAASGVYRDNRGRVVPNATVTPAGVATQFIGFKPAQLAREQDADQALRRYDTTMDYESGMLVNRMVRALRDGDKVAFNRMLPEARQFERNHPGHQIVDRAKDTYKREFKENDKALKTGVPRTRWTNDKRRKEMISPYISSLKP